jgi:hypothetical protein
LIIHIGQKKERKGRKRKSIQNLSQDNTNWKFKDQQGWDYKFGSSFWSKIERINKFEDLIKL